MTGPSNLPSLVKRWIAFNAVGAVGIAVQMSALFILTSYMKLDYLPATGLAVETAIVHNFFWHERWTWADRTKRYDGGVLRRLLYFQLTNGIVSLTGNLVFMRFFVEKLELNLLPANALAIALCSILNFIAGDRFVFRNVVCIKKGESNMYSKHSHIRTQLLLLLTVSFPFIAVSAKAANLSTETAKAWDAYVKMTEQRIKAEQSSEKKFLAFDFQDPPIAVRDRTVLFSGEILIKKIAPVRNIPVPDGMIHHWRGSIFIPAVSLDFVLDRVENPHTEDIKQEDVLAYNVLERKPGQLKIYLKLQRKKIVTAIYNTEHRVRYQRLGNGRAVSSSVATRIVEVERLPNNKEREKPEGSGRGFLWRMNSYWRYQQVEGGVIAECESLTLSRSIPFPLEYVVRPLINSVARESMARTLESLRVRMVQAYKLNHHNLES